jgi:hypothetical protein
VATERRARFTLGEVTTTRSALERLHALGLDPTDLLARHQVGDWGDLDDADYAMNEESLHEEQRFFSAYEIESERFWVVTAPDRSSTIVFLPGDAPPDPPPADS